MKIRVITRLNAPPSAEAITITIAHVTLNTLRTCFLSKPSARRIPILCLLCRIMIERNRNSTTSMIATKSSGISTDSMESSLDVLRSRIRGGFAMKIMEVESILKVLETRIHASDPRKVIERGFALVLDAEGRVLKGVAGRKAGDKVSMMFADGALECLIEKVR